MALKNINKLNDLLTINWPAPNVLAFSTTRNYPTCANVKGNLSNKIQSLNSAYNSFNLGLHVGDNVEVVDANRAHLTSFLPENSKIQWLEQIHESTVHHAKVHSEQAIIADAIYTTEKDIALAIMTADCLPILLSDHQGNEIAAIHGGWKPLAKNIIEQTVKRFKAKNQYITAWLGPCIGETTFEVSDDVFDVFTSLDNNFSQAFTSIDSNNTRQDDSQKYLCNLPLIASLQLKQLGITDIHNQSSCTVLNSENYYSYRRDTTTGRMASIICLM